MFLYAGGRKETTGRSEENRFGVRTEGRRGIDGIEREKRVGDVIVYMCWWEERNKE